MFCIMSYGAGVGLSASLFYLTVLQIMGKKAYVESLGGIGIISAFMGLFISALLGE